jgi:hypothetical protein
VYVVWHSTGIFTDIWLEYARLLSVVLYLCILTSSLRFSIIDTKTCIINEWIVIRLSILLNTKMHSSHVFEK